jgi:hypothetical protein
VANVNLILEIQYIMGRPIISLRRIVLDYLGRRVYQLSYCEAHHPEAVFPTYRSVREGIQKTRFPESEKYVVLSKNLIMYLIYYKRYTVKPVLNEPFIKRNLVLNGNIFRSRDYHSIP